MFLTLRYLLSSILTETWFLYLYLPSREGLWKDLLEPNDTER